MIRALHNAQDLKDFTFAAIRMMGAGLGLGLLLAITPVFTWLLLPLLAIYATGYRITDGDNNWTDDIEEYLAAVEDNK